MVNVILDVMVTTRCTDSDRQSLDITIWCTPHPQRKAVTARQRLAFLHYVLK